MVILICTLNFMFIPYVWEILIHSSANTKNTLKQQWEPKLWSTWKAMKSDQSSISVLLHQIRTPPLMMTRSWVLVLKYTDYKKSLC
jgi:hypothetical protein